jgi:hypothetical protein
LTAAWDAAQARKSFPPLLATLVVVHNVHSCSKFRLCDASRQGRKIHRKVSKQQVVVIAFLGFLGFFIPAQRLMEKRKPQDGTQNGNSSRANGASPFSRLQLAIRICSAPLLYSVGRSGRVLHLIEHNMNV